MAGIAFPSNLITAKTKINTSVSSSAHNNQIDTLEARDQYILDFLSKFDALPIGSILPTSIPYTEGPNGNMPNGWIWADGRYLDAESYPKLWELIKDTALDLDQYAAWANDQGFSRSIPNNIDPCGFYVITLGSKDDIHGARFTVPNLRGIYLRSIGNATSDDSSLFGEYTPDSMKEHTHTIPVYPVNGANLNSAEENIGIALTDKITSAYNKLNGTDGNHSEFIINKSAYTTDQGKGKLEQSETRPRSINYRFMLKVEFTDFTLEANVETDATSVNGYFGSIDSPLKKGNTSGKYFPISNPETGLLDSSWFDVSYLSEQVVTDISPNIDNIISNKGVLKDTSLQSIAVTAREVPTIDSRSVPVSDTNGKISTEYLTLATNSQIDSMFE